MTEIPDIVARFRELLKLKRRVLDKMKKHRKHLAKDRVEKKRINDEIVRLRKDGNIFGTMTVTEVRDKVTSEIKAVKPGDIYPKDLEREFDRLERTKSVKMKKNLVSLDSADEDLDEVPVHGKKEEDDEPVTGYDDESGVLDMSSEEPQSDD